MGVSSVLSKIFTFRPPQEDLFGRVPRDRIMFSTLEYWTLREVDRASVGRFWLTDGRVTGGSTSVRGVTSRGRGVSGGVRRCPYKG